MQIRIENVQSQALHKEAASTVLFLFEPISQFTDVQINLQNHSSAAFIQH